MLNAGKPLPLWPAHLRQRPCDTPFFDDILRARTRDEWTPTDLVVAAQLARVQSDIEREAEMLEAESTVLINERGTPVANPRVTVLERFAARQMALLRALSLAGTAAKGDKRDLVAARNLQRGADRARHEVANEDLLAT